MTISDNNSREPLTNPLQSRVDVALAVVFDPLKRVLICRRKPDAALGGYWEFPGGKCNPAESPAHAAVRESLEETSLVVEVVRALPAIEHEYEHARLRLHPFVCRWSAGNLEPREVAEARWVLPTELGQYLFPPANGDLVRALIAGVIGPA